MSALSASSAVAVPPVRRPWRKWVLVSAAVLVLAGWAALTFGLDPWLRREAEHRVQAASHGRYHLHIGQLSTNLWTRRLRLQNVLLRTVAAPPDSARLPRVRAALGRLELTGVGLWELLRGQEIPVSELVLDSVAVQLHGVPTPAGPDAPVYQRLPGQGVRIARVVVSHLHGRYGPAARPTVQLADAGLQLHDLRLSVAGAADSGRIGYAAVVIGHLRHLRARVPGHRLGLGRLMVDSHRRRLTLDSVWLHPWQPISSQRSPQVRVSLALPRLLLTGLNVAALTRRQFRADTLRTLTPRLALTLPARRPPSLHEALAPYLRVCRLNTVLVADGQLRVTGTELAPVVAGVQVQGTAIRVLPYAGRPVGMYYARTWQLRTGKTSVRLNAPYYHLAWQQLQADTRTGRLRLGRVQLVPTVSVVALARRKGHQAAHVTAQVPVVELAGFDFPAAINQGQLRADVLALRGARVTTRSDGRFPINPAISRVTPEALGQVPVRFALNQFRVSQATITMIYCAPRQAQPGTLQITRFGGTLRNISNDPARMSAARPLTGYATGRLQDQCVARLTLRANLLDAAGRHTVAGEFGPTPLAILDAMTVPTRGLGFRRGQVEHIRFQMELDQTAARGTMWGRYSNLKLQLFNRRNRSGILPRIGTTLVNGLIIRDDNPRKPGQELKPGRIISARERRFSVFSLWRQGLVSGLLNSAGVPAKLAKTLSEGE